MKKLLIALLLLALPLQAQTLGIIDGATPVIGGTTGQCVKKSAAQVTVLADCLSGAVTTFSGGTTGFTPSSATSGAVTLAGVLTGANGGSGVANTGTTFTRAGNVTFAGAFASILRVSAATDVTLPTTGTLATLAGSEALTNKSVNNVTLAASSTSTNYLGGDGSYYSGIRVIASSSNPASVSSGTAETQLAFITVPIMRANDSLRVSTWWSYTNSGNNKTLRLRFGGSGGMAYLGQVSTTTATAYLQTWIRNNNSTSSQKGFNSNTGLFSGGSASALVTSSVNTEIGTATLYFSGQTANSGERITLEAYTVELISGL